MKSSKHLQKDLIGLLPHHAEAVRDIVHLAQVFAEVQEILEPHRPSGVDGRSRVRSRRAARRADTAVLRCLIGAAEELHAACARLDDPAVAHLAEELARVVGATEKAPSGVPLFVALRDITLNLAAAAKAMTVKGKSGRPPEHAREWLERQIVQVLFDAGIPLKGTRGRPSVAPQIITTVLEYVGCRTSEEMRTAGTRRVLRLFAELAKAEKRGDLKELREIATFEWKTGGN